MRIAQLSDLHLTADGAPLYGRVDTAGALAAALRRLGQLDPRPDLAVFSGDLVNEPTAAAYARLAGALAELPMPWALLPGNHDDRAALKRAFPGQPWAAGPLAGQCRDVAGWRLVLLDATVPGADHGEIGDAQIAWLDAVAPGARPSLLFMHQPPFAVGIPGLDVIACRGEDRLAGWLADNPGVAAVCCGHVHRFTVTSFAGRRAVTAPSTAHQIALYPGPVAYTLEPGGFLVHDWSAGRGWLTHYLPVAEAAIYPYAG